MDEFAWLFLTVIAIVVTVGVVRIFEIIYNEKDSEDEKD